MIGYHTICCNDQWTHSALLNNTPLLLKEQPWHQALLAPLLQAPVGGMGEVEEHEDVDAVPAEHGEEPGEMIAVKICYKKSKGGVGLEHAQRDKDDVEAADVGLDHEAHEGQRKDVARGQDPPDIAVLRKRIRLGRAQQLAQQGKGLDRPLRIQRIVEGREQEVHPKQEKGELEIAVGLVGLVPEAAEPVLEIILEMSENAHNIPPLS